MMGFLHAIIYAVLTAFGLFWRRASDVAYPYDDNDLGVDVDCYA